MRFVVRLGEDLEKPKFQKKTVMWNNSFVMRPMSTMIVKKGMLQSGRSDENFP